MHAPRRRRTATPTPTAPPHPQIIFVGASGVGKTSLLERLFSNKFELNTPATIGACARRLPAAAAAHKKTARGRPTNAPRRDALNTHNKLGIDQRFKRLTIDGRAIGVSLWDTAGQERFQSLAPSYFRGAHGVVYGAGVVVVVVVLWCCGAVVVPWQQKKQREKQQRLRDDATPPQTHKCTTSRAATRSRRSSQSGCPTLRPTATSRARSRWWVGSVCSHLVCACDVYVWGPRSLTLGRQHHHL